MRDAILLTECGPDIGFGHLTRCQSMAEGLLGVGLKPQLWVAGNKGFLQGLEPVRWYEPEPHADRLREAALVVVDSFRVTLDQIHRLAAIQPRLAVLDDFPRRAYGSGAVIDWTLGAEATAFLPRVPGVLYLLGSTYCALRPPFALAPTRVAGTAAGTIFLNFGGSDVRGLTGPVLAMLQRHFPALRKQVVLGSGVADAQGVLALAAPDTTFYRACDAAAMRDLMASSDLAVCGGGQTLYELASQGLPPVVVSFIDNQEEDIHGFEAVGFAHRAGSWEDPDLLARLRDGLRELLRPGVHHARGEAGRRCVDGHGALRLARALAGHFRVGDGA